MCFFFFTTNDIILTTIAAKKKHVDCLSLVLTIIRNANKHKRRHTTTVHNTKIISLHIVH